MWTSATSSVALGDMTHCNDGCGVGLWISERLLAQSEPLSVAFGQLSMFNWAAGPVDETEQLWLTVWSVKPVNQLRNLTHKTKQMTKREYTHISSHFSSLPHLNVQIFSQQQTKAWLWSELIWMMVPNYSSKVFKFTSSNDKCRPKYRPPNYWHLVVWRAISCQDGAQP